MVSADSRPLAVTPFFMRLGQLFVEGRLQEMSRYWTFPCPIEISGSLVVMQSPEVLIAVFATRRTTALSEGLSEMTPRIIAIEMPRKGRFRVWLRWTYRLGDRIEQERNPTVYFMSRSPIGVLSIEMMDVVHTPNGHTERQSA